jgi:hypothetical protein
VEGIIEVRFSGLERALDSLNEKKVRRLGDSVIGGLAREAARRASELAPRRTGRLASSMTCRKVGAMRYTVAPAVGYAVFLELGVRPFPLYRAVPIEGVGFRYIAVHPGIAPHRFLERGAREAVRRIGELLRSASP